MIVSSQPRNPQWLLPGQFWIERVGIGPIGSGGLGRVYRVRVVRSRAPTMPVGSEWAAKYLNEKWTRHPEARARFEREIAALHRMTHPNIVACFGENLPGGERFYIMPLFSSSVRRSIAAKGRLTDWRPVAAWGAILADALHYAHGMGFVHRDLKPDNILFNPGDQLTIADWGLGYFVHRESKVLQHLTRGGLGTEYYCSNEQWVTGKCDARGDIYSLGMTLDEWVTGRQRPIRVGDGLGSDCVHTTSPGARHFNALLRCMTQRSREHRPASMAWVSAELRDAARR